MGRGGILAQLQVYAILYDMTYIITYFLAFITTLHFLSKINMGQSLSGLRFRNNLRDYNSELYHVCLIKNNKFSEHLEHMSFTVA